MAGTDDDGYKRGAGPYSKSPMKFTDASRSKGPSAKQPVDSDADDPTGFKYGGALSGTGLSGSFPKGGKGK
jgi:hypothetical protein